MSAKKDEQNQKLDVELLENDKIQNTQKKSDKLGEKTKNRDIILKSRKNRALDLLANTDLAIEEIARASMLPRPTIDNALKSKYGISIAELQEYRENKGEHLESAELALLRSALDAEKLHDMPSDKAINSLDKIYKLQRLHNGQSTSNVSAHLFMSTKPKE
jgi:DNA-binding transcriptional ArsR family regulator